MKAYERSLTHCMRMGSLEKQTAMRLFEGMEVKQDSQGVSVRYLTVVPFFQVSGYTISLPHWPSNAAHPACANACMCTAHAHGN